MYAGGRGVAQDSRAAYLWFSLALQGQDQLSDAERENGIKSRDRITGELTTDQFAEADRLVREWQVASKG